MSRPTKALESIRDWPALRREFEAGGLGYRKFAALRGIPPNTLNHRIMREGWTRNAILLRKTAKEIDARIQARVKATIADELEPLIAAEKVKFTKRGIKLANRGLSRVDKYMRSNKTVDAKEEAMISKAGSTYHDMGRKALGMNDGSPTGGAVNLNILTNQAAVQVVGRESQE